MSIQIEIQDQEIDDTKYDAILDIQQLWQQVPQEWQSLMQDFPVSIWQKIDDAINQDKQNNIQVFPYDFFYALKCVKPQDIKVVILGQDPYHNIFGDIPQAHGLAFSVHHGIDIPPSLRNIDIELKRSMNIPTPKHGCLDNWVKQGIFLLNSILSVQAHNPASHASIGWQEFTDYLITQLAKKYSNIVWLLWGKYAQSKIKYIDNNDINSENTENKHLILCTTHPSPLSAHRGFLGCGHFREARNYVLAIHGIELDFSR
jgi:uracil-DNA glycosylase